MVEGAVVVLVLVLVVGDLVEVLVIVQVLDQEIHHLLIHLREIMVDQYLVQVIHVLLLAEVEEQ